MLPTVKNHCKTGIYEPKLNWQLSRVIQIMEYPVIVNKLSSCRRVIWYSFYVCFPVVCSVHAGHDQVYDRLITQRSTDYTLHSMYILSLLPSKGYFIFGLLLFIRYTDFFLVSQLGPRIGLLRGLGQTPSKANKNDVRVQFRQFSCQNQFR